MFSVVHSLSIYLQKINDDLASAMEIANNLIILIKEVRNNMFSRNFVICLEQLNNLFKTSKRKSTFQERHNFNNTEKIMSKLQPKITIQ